MRTCVAWFILAGTLGWTVFARGGEIRGRLCITAAPCVEHICGKRIEAADTRRPFTLTTSDALYLGLLNAGDTAIACDGYGMLDLRLSARGRVSATILDASGASSSLHWDLQFTDRQIRAPIAIRLPRGDYNLTFEAPHHARVRKRLVIGDVPEHVAVELKPLPILSGLVLSRPTGLPLGGAFVTMDAIDAAIADATGHFAIEADPEKWPTKMTVSAAGYADSVLTPPRARISAKLDDILLSIGGSIDVELTGDKPSEPLQIELQKPARNRVAGIPLRTLERVPFTFENVEPGTYIVLAKGPKPGQRRGALVDLLPGERKHVRLDIKPFRLRLRAEMAGEPLANASIVLQDRDAHWEARFNTSTSGEVSEELWQGGKESASVFAEHVMTAPFLDSRTIADGEDTEWILDVPTQEIVGVVVDSATETPIPNASLALYVQGSDMGLGVHTRADEHGYFRFKPVLYGTHRLKAAAADYAITEMNYTFSEPERSRNLTVRLDRAGKAHITVVDLRGLPLAGARVIQYHGLRIAGAGDTDASGMIEIPVAKGEVRDIFVIPRDGSFGFLQLFSDAPQTLRIADGTSRIVIRAESESHAPIPGISAVMRYNGRVVPREVVKALAAVQGARVSSGQDGRVVLDHMPPGSYEFWPVGSPEELESMASAVGADSPVRMTVTPGENVAVLTFARAEKP